MYFINALDDRSAAELLINSKQYSTTLFHIEQLCEKSTKACLAIISILLTKEHLFSNNVKEDIIPVSDKLSEDFKSFLPMLRRIQMMYVRSRYGVDIEGRVSLDEYGEKEIADLYSKSLEYLELCFKFVEQKYGKPVPRENEDLKNYFKANYMGFVTK